jgi:hypothetical protein
LRQVKPLAKIKVGQPHIIGTFDGSVIGVHTYPYSYLTISRKSCWQVALEILHTSIRPLAPGVKHER